MTTKQNIYTCVSKPGEFEFVGTSHGAGSLKGIPLIVYRDLQTGHLLHREPEDFMARMKKIPVSQSGVNAELLAALEANEKFWTIREAELGELSPEAKAIRDAGLAAIAKAKGEAA